MEQRFWLSQNEKPASSIRLTVKDDDIIDDLVGIALNELFKAKDVPKDSVAVMFQGEKVESDEQLSKYITATSRTEPLQLVWKDEPAANKKQKLDQGLSIKDISKDICAAWVQPLDDLPTVDKLKAVLMEPLSKAIPVSRCGFAETIGMAGPLEDVCVINEAQTAKLFDTVTSTVMLLNHHGQSENSWIAPLDNLITTTLKTLAKSENFDLITDRNSSDISGMTVLRKRPDFLCWLSNGMLAFKGEEKGEFEDFRTAVSELVEKMEQWNPVLFGALPFQLCYAFAGGHIQFFAMNLEKKVKGTLTPISDLIDLQNSPESRSLCVRIVVNCYRVLRTLDNHIKQAGQEMVPLRLNATIRKAGSSQVVIYSDHVAKTAYKHSGTVLLELYESLQRNAISYLARPVGAAKINAKNVLRVRIEPVGFFRLPHGMDEIKCAMRCVLCALKDLHSRGWVHCDIRIENIMWIPPSRPPSMEWYLMDLEYARKDGDECPPICSEFRPPELKRRGGKWTSSCDMWQVGRLMMIVVENPDSKYRELMEALQDCNVTKRPTAHDVLLRMADI